MKPLTRQLLTLIQRAAALRASGVGWEFVGREIHRAPETVRRWPREHPDAWRRLYHEAEAVCLAEVAAESLFVLQKQLRSLNESTVFKAAQLLFKTRWLMRQHAAALAAEAATDNERREDLATWKTEVEKMTDAEMAGLAWQILKEIGGAPPAAEEGNANLTATDETRINLMARPSYDSEFQMESELRSDF
jgi:hypothetical protein